MEYNCCSRLFDNADAVEELKLTVNNLKEAHPALSAITTSKTLKILTLVCHGGDETISELCRETLEGSKSLTTLILELPECSDKGVKSLIEPVLAIKNLTSLTLRLNNVTENGAQSLATILSSTHIESFSIYGTQMDLHDLFIGDKGAEFVAIATQQCATLTKLCIAQSGITGLGVANVVQHLETHPSLMSLNLSYNLIDVNGVSGIAKSIPRIPMLQELILDNNKDIGDLGVKVLANVLNHTQSLKKLSLKSCDIGKDGLASLVERMQGLVLLNLSGNRAIGNEGAEFISRGLRNTETLDTLDLSSCDIRDEGCIHLADAILHNISLVYLSLHGNAISDGGVDSLSTALEKNRRVLKNCTLLVYYSQ